MGASFARRWTALGLLLLASAAAGPGLGCGEAQVEIKAPAPPPPPKDTDGDGFADGADKCVEAKEDGLDPDAKDGCPSDDPDKDGIKAAADKCADKPETVNGYQDDDGCPDEKPVVEVTDKEIKIADKILFQTGSASIDPASDALLQKIAQVLKDHADVEIVEIAGHADKRGAEFTNKTLTQRRAEAVVAALAGLGIDKARIRPAGYGSYCPLAEGDDEAALDKNRRVEFIILRRGGKDLEAKWGGCEQAQKKGMRPAPLPTAAAR